MLTPEDFTLSARFTALEKRVELQAAEINELKTKLLERDELLALRDAEIVELKSKLNKNSSNSSKPPSKDSPNFDRNQTRRGKTKKKVGGQKGHTGSTLEMVDNPDEISIHNPPVVCDGCGAVTHGLATEVISRHQEFDIPSPPPPLVTEHRVLGCTCGKCGRKLRGQLPDGVSSAPTSYGKRICGYVAYLSVRHYLPYARLKELILDLFGTSVSTGTLVNMIARKAKDCEPTVQLIKKAISGSEVVAADETFAREAGRRVILWIWCTLQYVYLVRGPNRAYEVVEREWPNGFPTSTLTSDRWSPQLKTPAAANQICAHHLLRECRGLEQRENATPWIEIMMALLKDIVTFGALGRSCYKTTYEPLEADLDELLDDKWIEHEYLPKGELKFYKGLKKQREKLTTCLYHKNVPPDNDDAERGVRGAKVKMNVSSQWRSQSGTQQYCTIRSVIATAIRQGLRPLDILMGTKTLNFSQST
ncbi:MAG: IS66 family transposase [Saprospiraceae bacterium]